ncbi:MAG TPA: hypothetical protein VHO92_01790 [Methanobacterium sp.]|nr:hypothetical protein [Methanobacterium sp.]
MNKIKKLSRKAKIALAGFCIIVIVMAVGIFGLTNQNPGTTQSVATDTVSPTTGTSSPNVTAGYTTKVDSIIESTKTDLNDSYTVLQNYANGEIDVNTAISHLQKDKTSLNNAIAEIQSLTPPQNLQNYHNLLVSAFQDLNQALSLEISGVQNNDMNDIQSAADLTNNAVSKIKEAKKERNQTS